ncbi:MAG: hypothetical protein KBS42_00260 [Bacteroidales bacterium]|nr:hypothetical protein [Candidatus Colicola coprequi]
MFVPSSVVKYCGLLLSLVWTLSLSAQDGQVFAERDNIGTARYVGMAGAMTAVGADPSAVLDNPAGLGLYRRFELLATFSENMDFVAQSGQETYKRYRFTVPQLSAVFAFGAPERSRGLVYSNLMFSYQRIKNFHRTSFSSLPQQAYSLSNVVADKTQGLHFLDLCADGRWDDENIGWLSCLGFDAYMIDTTANGATEWKSTLSPIESVKYAISVDESGSMDEYSLVWGSNISNRWYIGIGMGLRTLSYSKATRYEERSQSGSSVTLNTYLSQSALGVNGSFGVIYHPIRNLRLGLSFITPTSLAMTTKTNADILSANYAVDVEGNKTHGQQTPSISLNYRLINPLRTTVGAAAIFDRGLVSMEYDYAHQRDIDDIHTLKIGGEVVLHPVLFLNVGYAYESTFQRTDYRCILPETSVRTDLDFRNVKGTHFVGAAFGYRGHYATAQLGYQYRFQRQHFYAHECQTKPADMTAQTHRIVLTVAWHN